MAKPKVKAKPKAKAKARPKAKARKPAPLASTAPVLRSLRTCIYQVDDLPRAKAFYAAALDRKPYFDERAVYVFQ